ncbi:MAG TPA: glutamine synthetase family protein, partial [Candidatus Polarisedimenticolaceae bacterium]|nr:glutamine synthetase family protein [Candidatus Polarisedimenticolaceae bacterium]
MELKPLKNYLQLSYDELEKLNLELRRITDPEEAKSKHAAGLAREDGIKAVTLCFSDLEGRLHVLDYDKKFLLDSMDNLTFDGSSINGFTELHESDLRLQIDWTSLTYLPADVFGPGCVMVFVNIATRDLKPYESDFRGRLQAYAAELDAKQGYTAYMAPEIEGFLLDDKDAEQNYTSTGGFTPISTGGYYHALPLDQLRRFIDSVAAAIRAMGFRNEKDHPEVAPSQFEINYSHTDAVRACDQILLYKLTCRQIADSMGMTASFLPKPMQGINGSGMHTNFSLANNGTNVFYGKNGADGLSGLAHGFIDKLLEHAPELCLILNSSVNSYRRLDPNFEAPNQIKVTANDRGSMIRVPLASERSARIEIRSVSPDANPYLLLYTILKTGLEGTASTGAKSARKETRYLAATIQEAMASFAASDFMTKLLGESTKAKYLDYKQRNANMSPSELGTSIKESEI